MDGIQKAVRTALKEQKMENKSLSDALASSDQSRILVTRPSRQGISVLACSKLCAVCFVVGVVVGFTLKRRVKRYITKILKRMRDD